MKQTVRIIGGIYRGKKIQFPDIEGLRPTPDRVRETLFNWLMHDIRGAYCLDAFAGSGALGFEAFSRGAHKVVLIEQDTKAFGSLEKSAATFNSNNLQIIKSDAQSYLQKSTEQFDIIFLDPPFRKNYHLECINLIASSNLLKKDGYLYVESPDELAMDSAVWTKTKMKRAGMVVYALYQLTSQEKL